MPRRNHALFAKYQGHSRHFQIFISFRLLWFPLSENRSTHTPGATIQLESHSGNLSLSRMTTMAAKLMHALQYAGYGGGPSGLKVRCLPFLLVQIFSTFIIFVIHLVFWYRHIIWSTMLYIINETASNLLFVIERVLLC